MSQSLVLGTFANDRSNTPGVRTRDMTRPARNTVRSSRNQRIFHFESMRHLSIGSRYRDMPTANSPLTSSLEVIKVEASSRPCTCYSIVSLPLGRF